MPLTSYDKFGNNIHARLEEFWKHVIDSIDDKENSSNDYNNYIKKNILSYESLSTYLSFYFAYKLSDKFLDEETLGIIFSETYLNNPGILMSSIYDAYAYLERDPALKKLYMPVLFCKGFHAVQAYRISNVLWNKNEISIALFLQNRLSEIFGVDIHPAAKLGHGIFIDHATSIVIGETAVVHNDVSMLHEVTLGGTGKDTGDRHPKVHEHVLIGAGAKLLGNIVIGKYAKVGASSVVLHDVEPYTTVVGIPAHTVRIDTSQDPAFSMDQSI